MRFPDLATLLAEAEADFRALSREEADRVLAIDDPARRLAAYVTLREAWAGSGDTLLPEDEARLREALASAVGATAGAPARRTPWTAARLAKRAALLGGLITLGYHTVGVLASSWQQGAEAAAAHVQVGLVRAATEWGWWADTGLVAAAGLLGLVALDGWREGRRARLGSAAAAAAFVLAARLLLPASGIVALAPGAAAWPEHLEQEPGGTFLVAVRESEGRSLGRAVVRAYADPAWSVPSADGQRHVLARQVSLTGATGPWLVVRAEDFQRLSGADLARLPEAPPLEVRVRE